MAESVQVRAIRAFNDVREGDTAWVVYTPWVQGLVDGAYMEIIDRAPVDEKPGATTKRAKVVSGGEDQTESG